MSEEMNNENAEVVEEVEGAEEAKPEPPRELIEYEQIEGRLKEIEKKITTENLDMDESLELYEEAVNLGMKASQTIENNVLVNNDADVEEDADEGSSE